MNICKALYWFISNASFILSRPFFFFEGQKWKKLVKHMSKKPSPMWSIGTLCLPPRLSPLSFLLLHFLADCFLSTQTSDGEPFSALLPRHSGTSFQPAPQRRARASFCTFFYPLHQTQPVALPPVCHPSKKGTRSPARDLSAAASQLITGSREPLFCSTHEL